jgi:hypothetical protein
MALPAMCDSVLTLRCHYCTVAAVDFKPMRAYKDGRFVCDKCGHTIRPGEPAYICSCRDCRKWKRQAS